MTLAPANEKGRDLFRITPLYYSKNSGQQSDRLATFADDHRVADPSTIVEYLAFGTNWDATATFFRDVKRVPPGARLRDGKVVPIDDARSFNLLDLPARRLVEAFWGEFAAAVERAADAESVVISLSGGLDSAAIAVAAVERLGRDRVRAATVGHREDFEDPEPAVARAVCEHLGIDWTFVNADRSEVVSAWPETRTWPTEPTPAAGLEWNRVVGDELVLWGLGGDSILRGDRQHYAERLRSDGLLGVAADAARTMFVHGHRPGLGLSRWWRGRRPPSFDQPPWLRRTDGWSDIVARYQTLPATWRRGFDELFAPDWSFQFESVSVANNPTGPRYAFPFFDETFARFAARVPTAPWYIDKEILRSALRGRLPESVRLRPKTPVAGEALVTLTGAGADSLRSGLEGAAEFVDVETLAARLEPGVVRASFLEPVLRAAGVGRWLASLTRPA